MRWDWRSDLSANSERAGLSGAALAWIFDPGFSVVGNMRLATIFRARGGIIGKAMSKMMFLRNVTRHGCFLAPTANVGAALCLPHPIGIVIGEGAIVGANVTLYQGVTIGRRNSRIGDYPIVEDDVTIYAGAVIAGKITIGRGAVVGANSVVLDDVPTGGIVAGNPARIVKSSRSSSCATEE